MAMKMTEKNLLIVMRKLCVYNLGLSDTLVSEFADDRERFVFAMGLYIAIDRLPDFVLSEYSY